MIEGLKLTIAGTEVAELARAEAARLKEKAASIRKVSTIAAGQDDNMNSNIRNMDERASGFDAKAQELSFIADHLVLAETYQLDSGDLRLLGVVSGHW